jgi:hypothetical protein
MTHVYTPCRQKFKPSATLTRKEYAVLNLCIIHSALFCNSTIKANNSTEYVRYIISIWNIINESAANLFLVCLNVNNL